MTFLLCFIVTNKNNLRLNYKVLPNEIAVKQFSKQTPP